METTKKKQLLGLLRKKSNVEGGEATVAETSLVAEGVEEILTEGVEEISTEGVEEFSTESVEGELDTVVEPEVDDMDGLLAYKLESEVNMKSEVIGKVAGTTAGVATAGTIGALAIGKSAAALTAVLGGTATGLAVTAGAPILIGIGTYMGAKAISRKVLKVKASKTVREEN